MTIEKQKNGSELTVIVSGRLDTTTAPELETAIRESIDDVTLLLLDFTNLEYISSAGLRVLLAAQKIMNRQGQMIVRHINSTIEEIFEVTGFSEMLTVE